MAPGKGVQLAVLKPLPFYGAECFGAFVAFIHICFQLNNVCAFAIRAIVNSVKHAARNQNADKND
jgi:hypothetical protein